MNVAATMEAVHTHAPTQLAHSSAAVELDTHWQGIEGVAVVSRFIGWDTSRVASLVSCLTVEAIEEKRGRSYERREGD